MKNTYLVRGICTIAVLAALLTGCSSGGSDTDYVSELAGTWKATTTTPSAYSSYTNVETDTFTINTDGTFSRIEVDGTDYTSASSTDYYSSKAYTGTVSADEDSMTFNTKKSYSSYTNMTSIPTTGGTASTDSQTVPYFMKDNTVYTNVFTRKGSGSGIIGTWVHTVSESSVYSGKTVITDTEATMSITTSDITIDYASNMYLKGYPDNGSTYNSSDDYTYTTVDASTIKVTEHGDSTNWVYEISGDTLILKDSDATYVKQ